ncbi:MAG: metal-dependent phosphohydrolase [Chitinophagaceae bacterium]|nr:MAG: metal-dependent phosphohydrolase [Chitinophagaceae bacterium]
MTPEAFNLLKSTILAGLDRTLDPRLIYHSIRHTEDVIFHTERIALAEKITDARTLTLMKIAALFHDTGFTATYVGHEERSCEIMIDALKDYEFDDAEIKLMTGMIMATKVPQSPVNLPEQVICDADLDYLGREDFPVINKRLKTELLAFGFIQDLDEWNELQVNFLSKHRYFTNSSVILRGPVKHNHLSALMNFEPDKP